MNPNTEAMNAAILRARHAVAPSQRIDALGVLMFSVAAHRAMEPEHLLAVLIDLGVTLAEIEEARRHVTTLTQALRDLLDLFGDDDAARHAG